MYWFSREYKVCPTVIRSFNYPGLVRRFLLLHFIELRTRSTYTFDTEHRTYFSLSKHFGMEGSATFVYTELELEPPEIRLLRVFPAVGLDARVECALERVSLDDANYNALSYTWGDPKDLLTIYVNGHQFLVRRNLESALRHLRKTVKRQRGSLGAFSCVNDTLKCHGENLQGKIAAVTG